MQLLCSGLEVVYGACDVPIDLERLQFDLIIQFGHSRWVWAGGKDQLY